MYVSINCVLHSCDGGVTQCCSVHGTPLLRSLSVVSGHDVDTSVSGRRSRVSSKDRRNQVSGGLSLVSQHCCLALQSTVGSCRGHISEIIFNQNSQNIFQSESRKYSSIAVEVNDRVEK